MRKLNRLSVLLAVICAICSVAFFVSCKKDDPDSGSDGGYFPIDEEAQIALSDAVLEIEAGDERELTVSLYNLDGDVVWTTGDATVATVKNGLIAAVKEGKTTISATCGKLSASCEVTVKKSTAAPVIKTNFDEITLESGDSVTVSATVYRKNKQVSADVKWSMEYDGASGFTATEKDGKLVVTATAGDKKAVIFVSAELNGVRAYKSIEVSSVESGAIGKAEFIEETIKNLPDEISAMTVSEAYSLPGLFEGYAALGDSEKSQIADEYVRKLTAIKDSFSGADWKYLLGEKAALNSVATGENAGGKPTYVSENKIAQGEKFGVAFDYSRFKEAYFALRITDGKYAPALYKADGAFVPEQNKWYYFKNVSCSDGCVLMVSDEIDGEYSLVKTERYVNKNSAPKNLSELLILNNVSSVETLSWKAETTGIYTNSALDAVEVYAGELPEKEDSSAENWDDIFAAYKMLGNLTSEEKARISSEAAKIETLYAEWTDFFDKEVSSWGSVDVKNTFETSETASVGFGSAAVYKRSGVKADDDTIGKSGVYLDYNGVKDEYHFAMKATEAVRFKESRNYLLEADKWYIVKILKNPQATYGGWNIYVKPAGDTDYVKLDYAFEWRLGNHEGENYRGKTWINCFLVFTSEYGSSFDVYSTSMFAVDPPVTDPFVGMTKVAESALNSSAALQTEKFCNGDVYKLGGLTTNATANANTVGNSYVMDCNGSYSEYRMAIKVTESARICTGGGDVILKENNWYVVKFAKNADARYGGWNLFVKLAYESDDKFVQIAGDQWRLGNHEHYNGKAGLNCALAIYTINGWDIPFDVYATGLYAKA